MNLAPAKADPDDVASKLAAAPGLNLPPEPVYDLRPTAGSLNYRCRTWGCAARRATALAQLLFNPIVTYIPSHTIRQGFLRLFGATIGRNSSIMRGTTSSTSSS